MGSGIVEANWITSKRGYPIKKGSKVKSEDVHNFDELVDKGYIKTPEKIKLKK